MEIMALMEKLVAVGAPPIIILCAIFIFILYRLLLKEMTRGDELTGIIREQSDELTRLSTLIEVLNQSINRGSRC